MMLFCSVIVCIIGCSSWLTASKAETIKVTSILDAPYLHQRTEGSEIEYYGYIKDVLDLLADKMRVQFEIKLSPDGNYGTLLKNGTFTGMIGEVIKKDADLAAGSLTITSTRRRFVDFSPPFQSFGYSIVMKKSHVQYDSVSFTNRIAHLYHPLSPEVWLMSLVSYMVISTVMFFVAYVNPYEWRRLARDGEATAREGETFNCVNSFWFILSSWALQGFGARTPRSLGGRTVVLFWWAFVVIFVSTYIANLTNLLKVSTSSANMYTPIVEFEDLSKQTEIRYGMLPGGSTASYFRLSDRPAYKNIWEKFSSQNNSAIKTVADGVKKVSKARGRYAFIMESTMAMYYTKTAMACDLFHVGDNDMVGNYAFAYRTGYKHASTIDIAMLQLQETGTLQRLQKKWFTGVGKCENYYIDPATVKLQRDSPKYFQVTLGTFSGALIILLIGVIAGSLITAVEYFIYKKAESPRNTGRGDVEGEANDVSIPVLPAAERGVTKL